MIIPTQFRIDVFHHYDSDTKLDKILDVVTQNAVTTKQIQTQEKIVMKTLDDVLKDVQDESTVVDGLATLTAGLKAQLDAALAGQLTPDQQAKVDAIFAGVEANKQKASDALTANTPAATGGDQPAPTV